MVRGSFKTLNAVIYISLMLICTTGDVGLIIMTALGAGKTSMNCFILFILCYMVFIGLLKLIISLPPFRSGCGFACISTSYLSSSSPLVTAKVRNLK